VIASALAGAPKPDLGSTPPRVLIIGYGNLSRRDDGVAYHAIARLRQRLNLPPYEQVEDEILDGEADLVMLLLHQLAAELVETLKDFDTVVFVDAHVQAADWEPVHWQEIVPAYQPSLVTHHLRPAALLALCTSLYGRTPQGYVLSILGHDFDFGDELAPDTSARCDQAVNRLMELLAATGHA